MRIIRINCAAAARIAAASALLLGAASLPAQQIDPKEMRVNVETYKPRKVFTLTTEVKLVEVGAVVRDRDGKSVAGLTKEAFEIREDGKTREVAAFSVLERNVAVEAPAAVAPAVEAARPPPAPAPRARYIALVFDDLNTEFPELRRSQVAAARFVNEGISPGDQLAIFSSFGEELMPFTSDPAAMLAGIEKITPRNRTVDLGGCPQILPYEAYLIANSMNADIVIAKLTEMASCDPSASGFSYGAGRSMPSRNTMLNSSAAKTLKLQSQRLWNEVHDTSLRTLEALRGIMQYLGSLNGTRLVLLASGGFLTNDLQREQNAVVNFALRSGVVINSLDAKGLYVGDNSAPPIGANPLSIAQRQQLGVQPQMASNAAMAYLSQATGGRFFENNNDLARGFRELGSVPEVTYLLGFKPEKEGDNKFHRLEVKVNAPGRTSVQARPGYFAAAAAPAVDLPVRAIDTKVTGTDIVTEVPARVLSKLEKQADGSSIVTVIFDVKLGELPFTVRNGVHSQKLTMVAVLLDDDGNIVSGSEGAYDLALKDATYQRLAKEGFAVGLQMHARPGRYRLRGLVEEGLGNKVTAANGTLQVN